MQQMSESQIQMERMVITHHAEANVPYTKSRNQFDLSKINTKVNNNKQQFIAYN